MIKQTATGLNSRSEANPFNEDGFLPLITAPMYSVVDETNYQVFLDNKIQVCLPRGEKYLGTKKDRVFISYSLKDFIEKYIDFYFAQLEYPEYACIDTANGNMPELHDAIRKAKEIHGDSLVIMAGNVASVEAFIELAKTGVDYIRVGIGGGGGCNTTSNTGVGQENLHDLIRRCKLEQKKNKVKGQGTMIDKGDSYTWFLVPDVIYCTKEEGDNIEKVKIVADGISTYIKQCEKEYGFNDNGYAAINKLLFAGADLVMVGKLFAQCLESAGEKEYHVPADSPTLFKRLNPSEFKKYCEEIGMNNKILFTPSMVKYSGMSTQEEQKKYKKGVFFDAQNNMQEVDQNYQPVIKPSEGFIQWIPVRFLLKEWIWGNESQDTYPYLMGFVNSLKSAMSYTNKIKLQ